MTTAHLNGIDINYEVHGEGTPLVLAHGNTASHDMWREQVAALSAKYRLVIYDTRGHGGNGARRHGAVRPARATTPATSSRSRSIWHRQAYVGGLSMGA
jgi:pimeloyl-ACP methyl ester carboxylesterase